MDYTQHLLLFVIAVIANWFSALAGGGAGLIQLSILIFMGLPFSLALATHKVATVALGVGATVRHLKEKHSSIRLLALILVAGIPGVVLGAYAIIDINDRMAEVVLGCLTLSLALYSIMKSDLGLFANPIHRDPKGIVIGACGLFIIGIANGALSAGSGLFVTLWLVYWFGLSYRLAVAHTLIAVGLGWNASGALTMTWFAEVKWDWLPALLCGSFVGGYLGAHSSIVVGSLWIKRCYEIITLLVATKLLLG
ncbi:MAG: sulfite exporter TauE/SafE family protein [Oleispira sp.]|nr:sulfite exporter TauE/SafE family protein [Oleispira sp.]MBL4880268.1 sulfite exporter TauE/SafE family protein [Oleispira sp.]